MDEISDHAKNLTLSEDLERTIEERVNLLFDFVKVTLLCSLAWCNHSAVIVHTACEETKRNLLKLLQSTGSTGGGKGWLQRALMQTSSGIKMFLFVLVSL